MAEAVKKEEVKPKGPLGKLKEAVDDKEEQMAILSTFVRLGILIWAGGILTLNYVQFPGLSKQENIDPTFIASVFTGVLATFGVEAGQRKKNAASGGGSANITVDVNKIPPKNANASIPFVFCFTIFQNKSLLYLIPRARIILQ